MRVLLCGGGTAGHVMPAVAISEIIEKSFPGSVIAFAGRQGGSENDAYNKTKHKLYAIDIQGVSRSFSINNIKTVFKLIKSSRVAKTIVSEFKPDIIIGTGGYVCYPFLKIGQHKKIKTVIHESNVVPGLVTRLLAGRCDKVLLNHEETKNHLSKSKSCEVVGNPIRKDFATITKFEAKRKLHIPEDKIFILSFGGSLGANVLNETVLDFLCSYDLSSKNVYYVHATGKAHYQKFIETRKAALSRRRNIKILPYIDDMPLYLTAADLAITRSGAITISELSRCATPAILVPSPNVTANHQFKNAEYMKKLGAAVVIEEKDLNVEKLRNEILNLIYSPKALQKMSESTRLADVKNTDTLIANTLYELTNRQPPKNVHIN